MRQSHIKGLKSWNVQNIEQTTLHDGRNIFICQVTSDFNLSQTRAYCFTYLNTRVCRAGSATALLFAACIYACCELSYSSTCMFVQQIVTTLIKIPNERTSKAKHEWLSLTGASKVFNPFVSHWLLAFGFGLLLVLDVLWVCPLCSWQPIKLDNLSIGCKKESEIG